MDIHEFKRVLNLGLGRAILYLREHDPAPYREAILEECLHHESYDPQFDPDRAEYLFELIQLADNTAYFREPILEALGKLTEQNWDVARLFGLARRFAQRGDEQARRVMYERFALYPQALDWASEQFTELDGIAGLHFVAETLGAEMLRDPDYTWVDSGLEEWVQQHGGADTVMTLRQSMPDSRAVETYLSRLARELARPRNSSSQWTNPLAGFAYAQVKEQLERRIPSLRALRAWGREALEEDILQAAQDLLAISEDDSRRLRTYLQIFHERPFPLAPDRLFALARGSNEQRVAFMARGALVPLETPEVLDYARELLESGTDLYHVVYILFKHYPSRDHDAVEALLNRDLDAEEFHGAGMAIRSLVEDNLLPSATPALILIYEKGPCPSCREEVIRLLMAMKTLPEWVAAECRHDSSKYIRKLMSVNA